MNIQKIEAKVDFLKILLDSGCRSTIILGRLINKITPNKYSGNNGTHKRVRLIPIKSLGWNLRYLSLEQQTSWFVIVM